MKNYPLDFQKLQQYSQSQYKPTAHKKLLFQKLNQLKQDYHFPAVEDDVGLLLESIVSTLKPKRIFEFGSGYGHSLYWYLEIMDCVNEITLTEKRDDLVQEFHSLPWPQSVMNKVTYIQGDAFEAIDSCEDLDFVLIDGVKADYYAFLKLVESKVSQNAHVIIDNAYWRGSFLDPEILAKKKSAQKIKELHDYCFTSEFWHSAFLPYQDGIIWLRRKN